MSEKDINYYKELDYKSIITRINDESGVYFHGQILELDGCQSHGETQEEALKNLEEAKELWLEVKFECGDPIPEPISEDGYSGKFLARIPKSLHRKLAQEAAIEGVSLNQYVIHKLSR